MRLLMLAAAAAALLATTAPGVAADGPPLDILAAASLPGVAKAIDALWVQAGHPASHLVFAGSQVIAGRIQAGTKADLFLSSDEKPVDSLAHAGLVRPGSRIVFAANTLVLVVPAAEKRSVALDKGTSLDAVLGADGRLAIGDPTKGQAGIVAEQALAWLGALDALRPHLEPCANAREALRAVAEGRAKAAIVYGADVQPGLPVAVAGTFPAQSHAPLLYPAVVLQSSAQPAIAEQYLALLGSDAARAVLSRAGFTVAEPPR